MKSLLLASLFSASAFAQPNLINIHEVIKNSQIIGKTIFQDCDKVTPNEICENELKKLLSIYIWVDKDNKIERAGL